MIKKHSVFGFFSFFVAKFVLKKHSDLWLLLLLLALTLDCGLTQFGSLAPLEMRHFRRAWCQIILRKFN